MKRLSVAKQTNHKKAILRLTSADANHRSLTYDKYASHPVVFSFSPCIQISQFFTAQTDIKAPFLFFIQISQFLLHQIFNGAFGGDCTVCTGGYYLAERGFSDVTCNKHALYICSHIFICKDISIFVVQFVNELSG